MPANATEAVTGMSTRAADKRLGALTVTINKGDISNAVDGRSFLEKRLLLNPPGEPITNGSLATYLHQISEMPSINAQISTAVRSAAFLAEEIEEGSVNEMVWDAVVSQLNELAQDLKILMEDAKEKFNGYVQIKAK